MSDNAATVSFRKDAKVIGLVSTAHAFSHFYQLTLPPLFPLLYTQEGYTYTELGSLVALFYLVSGIIQPAAGFLVDRIGPRAVLYAGMGLLAGATALYGIADHYVVLVALATVAGAGNGVFHPSDYTLLSNNVSDGRVGRGFSFHAFGGYIGYALAPVLVISLGTVFGWREASAIVGGLGLVFLAIILFYGHNDLRVTVHPSEPGVPVVNNLTLLMRPVIIGCFLFFCAIAMAQIGLQTFAPSALLSLYDTPVTVSNAGITVFLIAVTVGILLGGYLADKSKHHHLIAMACLVPPAMLSVLPGWIDLPGFALWVVFAGIGLVFGLLIPSRDMLVRSATPRNASGKVFGVVYSGLDVGSALTPFAFGWLLDHQLPAWVFAGAGGCFALGILAILVTRMSPLSSPSVG